VHKAAKYATQSQGSLLKDNFMISYTVED